MEQNGYFDQNGTFFSYPNGYTDFFQMLYSLMGLFIFLGIVIYSLFIVFLVFLVARIFQQRKMKLKENRLKLEQNIVWNKNKNSKKPGIYLYDGTFVPDYEYDGCCVECLLLTKQLVSPSVCGELEIHKVKCSIIGNMKLEDNSTYI